MYYFREHQDVFLGIPQDYNTSIPYLEFNQGSTNGESKSGYADATYAITSKSSSFVLRTIRAHGRSSPRSPITGH